MVGENVIFLCRDLLLSDLGKKGWQTAKASRCVFMFKWAMLCGWPNSGESLFETRPKKEEFNKREKPLEVGFHRAYRMTSSPVYARLLAHVCLCMCVRAQDQILLSRNFEASFLCLFSPLVKEYRLASWHPDERWQPVWSCCAGYCNCHARTSSNTHTKSNLHQGEVEGGAEVTGQDMDCLVTKHLRARLWTKDEGMTSTDGARGRKRDEAYV